MAITSVSQRSTIKRNKGVVGTFWQKSPTSVHSLRLRLYPDFVRRAGIEAGDRLSVSWNDEAPNEILFVRAEAASASEAAEVIKPSGGNALYLSLRHFKPLGKLENQSLPARVLDATQASFSIQLPFDLELDG